MHAMGLSIEGCNTILEEALHLLQRINLFQQSNSCLFLEPAKRYMEAEIILMINQSQLLGFKKWSCVAKETCKF